MEGLARLLGPVEMPEDACQLGLRLDRTRRECDGGLRFRKRLIQMLILQGQLRPRDVVQRRRQRDLEVPVAGEQSIFNPGQ